MNKRFRLVFFVVSLAIFSFLFSLFKGSTSISLAQLLSQNSSKNALLAHTIFLNLRLPRTLSAFTSGALLALSGSLMQLLLQNPLADPYVLGLSGGAAFFTLLSMLLGLSSEALIGSAWIGSLLTIMLIMLLAKKHRFETHSLLLSGIALAFLFSAGISFILIFAPDASVHNMLFWLMGDLNTTRNPFLGLSILALGGGISLLLAPGLNILNRGEKEASALGLATIKYRCILYLLSSLFTASAVSIAGSIGFIGLIVPHLTRTLCGYDHRITLPISLLLGGSILTIADTFARSLFAPLQLPVGILMIVIGVPIFILLLQRS